jgi:glycosyltransferase involved in cell wall biosynthesis
MASRPLISIVCPAFREEEVLPRFHEVLVRSIEPLASDFNLEILYVDDGSSDGTLEVMRRLAAGDSGVRYLSLSRNFGKEAALNAGVEHAHGDAVVTIDTDLQHPPRLIPELVARWRAGAEVVLTIRAEDRRLSWFKRTTSKLFYRVLGWCSTVDVRNAVTDFRLMARPAVDALLQLKESHRYTPGLVQWVGFRTAEVHFVPDARPAGATKYHAWNLMKLALDALFSFSPAPVRLAVIGGLTITGLSWLASLVLVLALIGWGDSVGRLGAIALTALHGLAATGLLAAGALGEYAYRIYEQVKGRPGYLIKERKDDAIGGAVRLPTERKPPIAA